MFVETFLERIAYIALIASIVVTAGLFLRLDPFYVRNCKPQMTRINCTVSNLSRICKVRVLVCIKLYLKIRAGLGENMFNKFRDT